MKIIKKIALFVAIILLFTTISPVAFAKTERKKSTIIREMVNSYCTEQAKATKQVSDLLQELKSSDKKTGKIWDDIMCYWRYANFQMNLNYDALPADLEDSSNLCLIVLGFQLNPDGSIQPELEQRLQLALSCAEQYPDAYILCAGGGTAKKNKKVTEAGQMARWLKNHGVDSDRIIVENKSYSTTQNAVNAYQILRRDYPNVNSVAILTSDYHAAWGSTLFQTKSILASEGQPKINVVSNAVCRVLNCQAYAFEQQAKGILDIAGL